MPSIAPRISCSSSTWSTYSAFTRSSTDMNWSISRDRADVDLGEPAVAAGMKAIAPTRPSERKEIVGHDCPAELFGAASTAL